MPTDNAIRASDADRERAVEILRDGYASGRLTLAEFDERTTAAFASRTWGELRALTNDLPVGTGPAAGHHAFLPSPPRPPRQDGAPPSLAGDPGADSRFLPVLLIAVFWLAVTLSAHAPGALIPVVFLLLMAVRSAARARCGPGRRDGRQDPRGHSQRPGGPA
jgi:Domain of unknown function (DUF1707)